MAETTDEPRSGYHIPPPPLRTPPFTYTVGLDPVGPLMFERRYGRTTRVLTQVFSPATEVAFDPPIKFHSFGRVKVGLSSDALNSYPNDLYSGNWIAGSTTSGGG